MGDIFGGIKSGISSLAEGVSSGIGEIFPDADRVKITDPEEKEALIKAFNEVDDEDDEALDKLGKLGYTMPEDPETGEVEISRNKTKDEKLAEFSTAMDELGKSPEQEVLGGGAALRQPGSVSTQGTTAFTDTGIMGSNPYETTQRRQTSSDHAAATQKQVAGLLANPAIRDLLFKGLV